MRDRHRNYESLFAYPLTLAQYLPITRSNCECHFYSTILMITSDQWSVITTIMQIARQLSQAPVADRSNNPLSPFSRGRNKDGIIIWKTLALGVPQQNRFVHLLANTRSLAHSKWTNSGFVVFSPMGLTSVWFMRCEAYFRITYIMYCSSVYFSTGRFFPSFNTFYSSSCSQESSCYSPCFLDWFSRQLRSTSWAAEWRT